ncbi:sulfite exporter TauE/SafE family protein [Paenibacillus silvae]|uniref:Probable membrane transporter protein n=1 Tax=Paenibacillus silvae TaxID=1325358 RepID=A0A2W6NB44_9BACL|nr:sulfite exporter TauE/SafE family protein [Paenibacillus silvae]PZT52971.1 sulfite exporter TauE/SafE family protein [Paenibacillus silvae]
MDLLLFIIMFILGLIGSFFSGLLGIGGAIINFPLLLYVPEMAGLEPFTAHQVSAISMFQVFFASLAGVLAFRRKAKAGTAGGAVIHSGLVLVMGSSILVGSLIGAFISGSLNERMIHLVYGILAVIAIVLMLIPSKGSMDANEALSFNKTIAASSSFAVGIVSGIVGAGGAFVLIPIMLTVLQIPVRTTIASSLAIVFISAIGGVIGKITAGNIPVEPIIYTVLGSLIGASIGSRASSMINVRFLRYALLLLIAITAIKVWSSIFN